MRPYTAEQVAMKSGYPENFVAVTDDCHTAIGLCKRQAAFKCKVCGLEFKTRTWSSKSFSCLCGKCLCKQKSMLMKERRSKK